MVVKFGKEFNLKKGVTVMVFVEIAHHQKVKMSGHANAGEYGEDLVCAALTGIMSGALNAFDQKYPADVKILVKDNLIELRVLHANPALTTMLEMLTIQLKTIAEQYPKNVQLKEVD
jgi:uncharacterized protein